MKTDHSFPTFLVGTMNQFHVPIDWSFNDNYVIELYQISIGQNFMKLTSLYSCGPLFPAKALRRPSVHSKRWVQVEITVIDIATHKTD